MKAWQKITVVAIGLLAAGVIRMPYEAALTSELRHAKLITAPLPIGTREKIGQTSSAVALGGLRTLVATFLNLRAFTAFTEQRWPDVLETFETIVDLAPHTLYYWSTGSWHMSYNAAPYYRDNMQLSPLRRREAWRSSILTGRAFLERGIRNNPEGWELYRNLGFLLSDKNKILAFGDPGKSFSEAAEAYRIAADSGKLLPIVRRNQFYALARIPGREKDALAMGNKLYAERTQNRAPTLCILLVVLEHHLDPTSDPTRRAIELFSTPAKAYAALSAYWKNGADRFPMDGVALALQNLENTLGIPAEKSLLSQPVEPVSGPDDWFR